MSYDLSLFFDEPRKALGIFLEMGFVFDTEEELVGALKDKTTPRKRV